jgi:GNAT superfamily N-acetyltransferase
MIVHRSHQRRGIASQLLASIDDVARANGRTLLMLDTETDSGGEHLYASNGWVRFGIVPDHAHSPDGSLKPTSFFYRMVPAAAT